MSKQKVRPMIDKDLRDEIVNYCGGGESLNSALRHYTKEMHSLNCQVKYRDFQIMELMKKNNELSATLDEEISRSNYWLTKWNKDRNDLLMDSKIRKIDTAVFRAVCIVIGAAVMTFAFNVT